MTVWTRLKELRSAHCAVRFPLGEGGKVTASRAELVPLLQDIIARPLPFLLFAPINHKEE
jgi:hypothetical protein